MTNHLTRTISIMVVAVLGAVTACAPEQSSSPAQVPALTRGIEASGTGAPTAVATPTIASGSARIVTEPANGLQPIYRLLGSARHRLDMTMYELVDSRAEHLLEADAQRGVVVRVLLDQNRERTRNEAAYKALSAHGVHVRWAPKRYEATHEKAFVVDGRVAVIMTLNLTARYYADTRDFAVIDTDRSDVAAVENVFGADFSQRVPSGLPRADHLVWSPGSQAPLVALIRSARHSLDVETEEMTDRAIIGALGSAARRGVDVELTMTENSEEDRQLAELRADGVHVRVLPENARLYIHAKVVVVDRTVLWIGSENFSTASLERNRELGLTVRDRRLAASVAGTLRRDHDGAG